MFAWILCYWSHPLDNQRLLSKVHKMNWQCEMGANPVQPWIKGPCKVRNTVACNILIIFQLVLTILELALITEIRYRIVDFIYMLITVAGNVVIIITVCLPAAYLAGPAHTGHIHAWNVYEFFNLIVLCFLTNLLTTDKSMIG